MGLYATVLSMQAMSVTEQSINRCHCRDRACNGCLMLSGPENYSVADKPCLGITQR
jgi:hypothetical protein